MDEVLSQNSKITLRNLTSSITVIGSNVSEIHRNLDLSELVRRYSKMRDISGSDLKTCFQITDLCVYFVEFERKVI